MSFLKQLNWRFAAKDFDPSKDVEKDKVDQIIEAIHMTPTSYGLQPFHVYIVSNQETKEKLHAAGYKQPQFLSASHVLVFCARTDVQARVDTFVEETTGGKPEIKEKMAGFISILNGFAEGTKGHDALDWAAHQTYIALGFAMAAAAEVKLDSCPMEGFKKEEFDQILKLPEHMKSQVALTLGYRIEDPRRPKFRYSKEDLFTVL